MGQLIKPKINRIYKTKVVQLTKDLSLRSTCIIVTVKLEQCPNCLFDPATKSSSGTYRPGGPQPFTGKVCPVCKQKGKIDNEARQQIPANVRWGAKPPQPYDPQPEGIVPEGFARIKCEVKYHDLLFNATYFVVDNIRCSRVDYPHKRGLLDYVMTEMLVKMDE